MENIHFFTYDTGLVLWAITREKIRITKLRLIRKNGILFDWDVD